jgi:hypothetical protein
MPTGSFHKKKLFHPLCFHSGLMSYSTNGFTV